MGNGTSESSQGFLDKSGIVMKTCQIRKALQAPVAYDQRTVNLLLFVINLCNFCNRKPCPALLITQLAREDADAFAAENNITPGCM